MARYIVRWEINIDAASPLEAATKAHEIQQDPDSVATVFEVARDDTLFNKPASWEYETIDLLGEKVERDRKDN